MSKHLGRMLLCKQWTVRSRLPPRTVRKTMMLCNTIFSWWSHTLVKCYYLKTVAFYRYWMQVRVPGVWVAVMVYTRGTKTVVSLFSVHIPRFMGTLIFLRLFSVNPSLSSSIHCSVLRMFACCRPGRAVRSWIHFRLQLISYPFVLVSIWNLNTTAVEGLNKYNISETGCSSERLLCVWDEHSDSISGSVLTNWLTVNFWRYTPLKGGWYFPFRTVFTCLIILYLKWPYI
jgi:hypothetical protein